MHYVPVVGITKGINKLGKKFFIQLFISDSSTLYYNGSNTTFICIIHLPVSALNIAKEHLNFLKQQYLHIILYHEE